MNVSRETEGRLAQFVKALEKWNKAINLVAPASLVDVWDRHIEDSLQIADHVDFGQTWIDLGSGGGLPGLVLAILAKETSPETQFTLVESDARKCAFLRSTSVALGLNITILNSRIESCPHNTYDTVSARALAPLTDLIGYAKQFHKPGSVCVFPKGQTHLKELEQAQNTWTFDFDLITSKTNPNAALVIVRNIE